MLKKRILPCLIAVLISFTFFLTACNGDTGEDNPVKEQVQLGTPLGLEINDRTASWFAVANAAGYTVKVDETEYTVSSGTTYSLAAITEVGKHQVSVKASGYESKEKIYLESGYGQAVEYGYWGEAGNPQTLKLDTPSGVVINQDLRTASWNPVKNAKNYNVKVGGTVISASTTNCSLASVAAPDYLSVSVSARGYTVEFVTFTDSDYSESAEYFAAKSADVVHYSDFGATGNGSANDLQAIINAHAAANAANKPVKADEGKKYYIGGADASAVIQTDTDWSGAEFIIDDTSVVSFVSYPFTVTSKLVQGTLENVVSLTKGQTNIGRTFEQDSLVRIVDNTQKRYHRNGNAANGVDQQEIIKVDKDGNVDPTTPIMWNYNTITITAIKDQGSRFWPIDAQPLTITGGKFTTIANQAGNANYYNRGILINRSNTVIDGLEHYVTNEKPDSPNRTAPYNGFLIANICADVMIKNCKLTARRVSVEGSYDISATSVSNLTVKDCTQTNSITAPASGTDGTWGIFGSNYCKNIVFDGVYFSRFDAHAGVYNVTIRNSQLGTQGISIIGAGLLHIENTTVSGINRMVNLRDDYGSTWEGEVYIKNCTLNSSSTNAYVIYSSNTGANNYGYQCYVPSKLTVDGLHVTGTGENENNLQIYYPNTNSSGSGLYPVIISGNAYVRGITRSDGEGYVKTSSAGMSRFAGITLHTSW